MAVTMDALSSFVFLTDNIPQWLDQVQDLSGHIAKRHSEFAAEYTRLLKHAKPRKQKTASLASNRSDEKTPEADNASARSSRAGSSMIRNRLNPLEAGNKYLFANLRKAQKVSSQSVRSGASGPQRFRQKFAVVVYYDSSVQQRLETMVKNINTARNNLRKGKKARLLATGPSIPSFNFPSYGGKADPFGATATTALFDYDPKGAMRQLANHDTSFDETDKILEAAQSLFETAAHQFLRDGDAKLELDTARIRLEEVIGMAEKMVATLKAEEEGYVPENETPELEEDKEIIDLTKFDKMTPSIPFIPTPQSNTPSSKYAPLPVIEVDDDIGFEELNYLADASKLRSMVRAQMSN